MRQLAFLCSATLLLAGGSRVLADAKNPTYDDDVLPIVKQSCINCHGNDKQKGGLNLATYAAMNQGGSSGAVVVPGKADKSRIYTLSAHLEEPKMPPSAPKSGSAGAKSPSAPRSASRCCDWSWPPGCSTFSRLARNPRPPTSRRRI